MNRHDCNPPQGKDSARPAHTRAVHSGATPAPLWALLKGTGTAHRHARTHGGSQRHHTTLVAAAALSVSRTPPLALGLPAGPPAGLRR